MFYVGVDACRVGWLAVILEEKDSWQLEVFPNISSLWEQCKGASLDFDIICFGHGSPLVHSARPIVVDFAKKIEKEYQKVRHGNQSYGF